MPRSKRSSGNFLSCCQFKYILLSLRVVIGLTVLVPNFFTLVGTTMPRYPNLKYEILCDVQGLHKISWYK